MSVAVVMDRPIREGCAGPAVGTAATTATTPRPPPTGPGEDSGGGGPAGRRRFGDIGRERALPRDPGRRRLPLVSVEVLTRELAPLAGLSPLCSTPDSYSPGSERSARFISTSKLGAMP